MLRFFFLSRDKPNPIAVQSLSSFRDKGDHSGLITACWQRGRNHDCGAQKSAPHQHHLHASDTKIEIGRTQRQTARNVLWFQQECLLSNCISLALAATKEPFFSRNPLFVKGSAPRLWKQLAWSSSHAVSMTFGYQNCRVTKGQAQQSGLCQTFLLSRFRFDLIWWDNSIDRGIKQRKLSIIAAAFWAVRRLPPMIRFIFAAWERAFSVCHFMPAWPSVPASCLKARRGGRAAKHLEASG